ncbi:MAG: hypothetical protein SFY81_15965 [Verrucomicrobiota bacterium]|nr:hypothetical protein [Verrucomicrobiota bacterium]
MEKSQKLSFQTSIRDHLTVVGKAERLYAGKLSGGLPEKDALQVNAA